MTWAIAHRTINTILILLIALALFTVVDRLICAVEQEHTLPQCEQMLYEKIIGDEV